MRCAFGIWPEMWKSYGIMGGWLAAAILVGICWYMNHWLGIIWNQPGRIWVDQGWAVCSAGIAWAMVRFNAQFRAGGADGDSCCLSGRRAGRRRRGPREEAQCPASSLARQPKRPASEGPAWLNGWRATATGWACRLSAS